MKDNIEISPYGNMLMFKKGYTAVFVERAIERHRLDGLRIFDYLDRLDTLDFLTEYNFLRKLDIDCIYDHNYTFLNNLSNLKYLGIGISTKQLNIIDLSKQEKLESLGIQWRKKIIGLENCKRISSLTVVDFKEKGLQKLAFLISLAELCIKTTTIESLNGLEAFVNLQSLSVGNSKKLISIEAINKLPKLQHVEFNNCPNIKDYRNVISLPNLQSLSLIDCGRIESIKFIEGFPLLSKLSLLGNTVINDGDLSPVKRLKSFHHKHYNHYNIKIEDAAYNETIKSNLQKVKKYFK